MGLILIDIARSPAKLFRRKCKFMPDWIAFGLICHISVAFQSNQISMSQTFNGEQTPLPMFSVTHNYKEGLNILVLED